MALVTGTPLATIQAQDDIYIDRAPSLWFQDSRADPLNNPDGDNFYWGITGSATYDVYEIDCYDTVQLVDGRESNPVRCDTIGDKGTIQKRNAVDLTFNLKTFFPFETLTHIMNAGGAVTVTPGATEKFGIGQIDNNQFWRVYGALVYDENAGDYFCFTGHRCQFVDGWTIAFNWGSPSTIAIVVRCFADDDKPSGQEFMTLVRADPSAI